MKHIRRNICLMAVSCVLLASAPTQSMAQTGRTARTQASQNQKITVSGTVLDKTTNEPLIGVSVVVKGVPPDLFVNTPVLNCHAKTFLVDRKSTRLNSSHSH